MAKSEVKLSVKDIPYVEELMQDFCALIKLVIDTDCNSYLKREVKILREKYIGEE